MTALAILLACTATVAAVVAVVAVVALVALRRTGREAAREAAALQERLDAMESRVREAAREAAARPEPEYVITRMGRAEPVETAPVPVRLPAPAFADVVLRETVVQAASWVHGLRRALAPETRNRIRFEMRRELKRTRKARKAEVKEALREYRARRRTEVSGLPGAGTEGAA